MTVFASGRGAITRAKGDGGGVTAPNAAAAATEYYTSDSLPAFTNITPTVHADTELLVVIVSGIRDATAFSTITVSSDVDGALTAKVDPPDPTGPIRTFAGVWYLVNPTAGAHTITVTKNGGGNLVCLAAIVLQLKDVDATPFEAEFDYSNAGPGDSADVLTLNGTLNVGRDNSLVVAFAGVEDPNRTSPLTFNESLVEVHQGTTGTGTGADVVFGAGSKVQAAASGAVAWEIAAAATDDWAAGAVAIRGKSS